MMLLAFFNSILEFQSIEIAWIGFAAIGALISAYNLIESWKDWKALKAHKIGNGRKTLAETTILAEVIRVVVQLYLIVIGVWALAILPDATTYVPVPLPVEIFAYLFRYGMLATVICLGINAWLAYNTRRKIIEHLPVEFKEPESKQDS
jgi:hypothetical protein